MHQASGSVNGEVCHLRVRRRGQGIICWSLGNVRADFIKTAFKMKQMKQQTSRQSMYILYPNYSFFIWFHRVSPLVSPQNWNWDKLKLAFQHLCIIIIGEILVDNVIYLLFNFVFVIFSKMRFFKPSRDQLWWYGLEKGNAMVAW